MAKLPRPSGKDMLRFLQKQGFTVVRVHSSHHIVERGAHRTSVTVHGSRPLKFGTLRSILRDIDMSPSEFEQLWHA